MRCSLVDDPIETNQIHCDMKAEVIRTVHPIGQGGFYTETLMTDLDEITNKCQKEYTVVYDCGGNSQKSMELYLKKYLHKNPDGSKMKIDAVFISHLHADHVNGLEYLLKNADVRLLILPQLDEVMLLDALVYNYSSPHSKDEIERANSLILELSKVDGHLGQTRIVQVGHAEPEEMFSIEEAEEFDVLNPDGRTRVNSRTLFMLDTSSFWVYVPYNPPAKCESYKKFMDAMKPYIGDSIESTAKKIKGHIKDCKKIYEKYFGEDHNAYSMTLYSGLGKQPHHYWVKPFGRSDRYSGPRECYRVNDYYDTPNCLFTGDFEPDLFIDDLKRFYSQVWKGIRSIQVPHHGSRNNYHQDFYEYAIRGFISAGVNSKHHHPNIDTLINIRDHGCQPVVVTENLSSIRTYHYVVE